MYLTRQRTIVPLGHLQSCSYHSKNKNLAHKFLNLQVTRWSFQSSSVIFRMVEHQGCFLASSLFSKSSCKQNITRLCNDLIYQTIGQQYIIHMRGKHMKQNMRTTNWKTVYNPSNDLIYQTKQQTFHLLCGRELIFSRIQGSLETKSQNFA